MEPTSREANAVGQLEKRTSEYDRPIFRGSLACSALANFHDPVPWSEYVLAPEFWNRTLQNWQSEFLAVGSMVVLSIYLHQRGSPESKPLGAAHDNTASTG
jgi:hypothetical protein